MKFLRRKKAFTEYTIEEIISAWREQFSINLPAMGEAQATISATKKIIHKDLSKLQKAYDSAPFKVLGKYKKSRYKYSDDDIVFYQSLIEVILNRKEYLEEKMNLNVKEGEKIRQLYWQKSDEIIHMYRQVSKEKKFPTPIDSPRLSFQLPTLLPNLTKKERNFPLKYEIAAAEKRDVIRVAIAELLRDISFKADYSSYRKDNLKKQKKSIRKIIRKANSNSYAHTRVLSLYVQNLSALAISHENLVKEHFQIKYRQVLAMIEQGPYALEN